jgi:hypothetical protein
MTATHTPGAWRYALHVPDNSGDGEWWVIGPTSADIIAIVDPHMAFEADAAEANTRLIAAAPDMLDALRCADECCQQGLNSCEGNHWEAALQDIMGLVRDAIAKATGAK